MAEHVDGPGIGGRNAVGGQPERESEFLERAVAAPGREGAGGVGAGRIAHLRDFPHELDAVLGFRVVHLGGVGQALAGRAPPALGQEIVEQMRIAAHDPQLAPRAVAVAVDVIHAEDVRRMQMRRKPAGAFGVPKPVPLPFEIGLPPFLAGLPLVFRNAGQQLEIHQGIGRPAAAIVQEPAVPAGPDDRMLRFCVQHVKAGLFHVRDGSLQHFLGESRRIGVARRRRRFGRRGLRARHALNPFVNEDVLPEDVQFHVQILRLLAVHFRLGAARLPEFQAPGRNENGERLVGADRTRPGAGPHFHQQRELLVRGIEIHFHELHPGTGVHRHVFAHPAPFDDQILAGSRHRLGSQLVDRARALQRLAAFAEPFFFQPVFGPEVGQKRPAKRRHVQIGTIGQPIVVVGHAQKRFSRGNGFFLFHVRLHPSQPRNARKIKRPARAAGPPDLADSA